MSTGILSEIIERKTSTAILNEIIEKEYFEKHVIIRSYASGVHIGSLRFYDPVTRTVILNSARCIWSWSGALSVYEISQNGISDGKLTISIPELIITDVLEIIVLSEKSSKMLTEKEAFIP